MASPREVGPDKTTAEEGLSRCPAGVRTNLACFYVLNAVFQGARCFPHWYVPSRGRLCKDAHWIHIVHAIPSILFTAQPRDAVVMVCLENFVFGSRRSGLHEVYIELLTSFDVQLGTMRAPISLGQTDCELKRCLSGIHSLVAPLTPALSPA